MVLETTMASRPRESESPGVDPRIVLVISDDVEFSRAVSERWQRERAVPTFMVLGSAHAHDVDRDSFQLAIVGRLGSQELSSVLRTLESSGKPVILLCDSADQAEQAEQYHREFVRLLPLRQDEGWLETLILLANEVLRRTEAVQRAQRAEQINALLRCHATLGQYVIDMRHTMNNALTSVLGNAELMLLEPVTFSAGVRSQIDTIRNMALRLHEILQRFSSLEKEMTFVEKQAAKDRATNTQAAVAGQ
jgi:signal transduction histidine kinase